MSVRSPLVAVLYRADQSTSLNETNWRDDLLRVVNSREIDQPSPPRLLLLAVLEEVLGWGVRLEPRECSGVGSAAAD